MEEDGTLTPDWRLRHRIRTKICKYTKESRIHLRQNKRRRRGRREKEGESLSPRTRNRVRDTNPGTRDDLSVRKRPRWRCGRVVSKKVTVKVMETGVVGCGSTTRYNSRQCSSRSLNRNGEDKSSSFPTGVLELSLLLHQEKGSIHDFYLSLWS